MGSAMVHELYTAASGLYVCWLSIRAATVLLSWMPQGRTVIMLKVHEWTLMVMWISVQPTANISFLSCSVASCILIYGLGVMS